jgi:lipid A 3-O-deacylase
MTGLWTATMRLRRAAACVLLGLFAVPAAYAADQPLPTLADIAIVDEAPLLQIGVGAFNVLRDHGYDTNEDLSAEGRIELRSGRKYRGIGLLIGGMINSDEGLFGYTAIYTDFAFGNWILSPSGGVGAYSQGDSKDLGGTFQFHAALDLGYRFENGTMLGVKATHISNAGLNRINPGQESVLLTFSIPLGRY